MARVFIATLNYAPEPSGFAPRATALAEHLAAIGYEVHVFTGFPFAPNWRRRADDRGRLLATKRSGRVTIHRLTHFIPRTPSSALQRIAMEGSFALCGIGVMTAALVRSGPPDAVMYVGAQPAIAMLARVVAAMARCPYIVNITDLAAQLALDVGIVGRRLYPVLDAIEFAAYARAARANVLCRSFADALVEHGYPASRIRVSRDPIDLELIRPVARDPVFRAQHGIPEHAFVALHAGSMGLKQGLGNIIAGAALAPAGSIRWVLVGEGEAKSALIADARARGLQQAVHFLPFQPDENMSAMFAAADVLVLNQLSTVTDTVIPSKLLTYMAAGRPVIAAVNPRSQAADILREADGGRIVAPEDPQALAGAVGWCQAQPDEVLADMGKRNRSYAEEHFDQHKILPEHERILRDAIASHGSRRR